MRKVEDSVTVKTKMKGTLTVGVNEDEAKKLDERNRQTGCTGPNVNDVIRRVVE